MTKVRTLLYLSILLFCSCNEETLKFHTLNASAITNGETKAKRGEFSWLVKVDTCAGVIVDKRFILTVAHCVHDKWPSLITLRGGHNGVISELNDLGKAKKIIVHHDYIPFSKSNIKENDIALIELKEDIIFTETLNKAQLPAHSSLQIYDNLILGGYGKTEDQSYPKELHLLKELELLEPSTSTYWNKSINLDLLKSDDDDQDFIGTYFTNQYLAVKVNNEKSACRGDSGAPLVSIANNTIVGLVSHGSDDCSGQKAFFLTKVSHYTEWIKQEMSYENN